MAKKKQVYLRNFSTNTKYTINSWTSFSELLKKYGSSAREEAVELLLESAVLEDAFNGGFSFCMRDLANILVKIEQVLIMIRTGKEDSDSLTPELLTQFGCEKINIERLMPAKIEKLRKKILAKIGGFDRLLGELHVSSCTAIKTHLREREILINENEVTELALIESRYALVRRLDNLALGALQDDEVLSFASYFRYKTSIILKNALSRMQKSHGDNDVQQTLRKLKPCFDGIKKEANKFVVDNIHPLQKLLEGAVQVDSA